MFTILYDMVKGIVKLRFIDEKRLRCEMQKLENELEVHGLVLHL